MDAGARWAIVTSGRRDHVLAGLARSGLPIPSVLVCGEDVTHGKPAPDCFLAAARRLGVRPASCTVVEDAPVGIMAAKAAGMEVVAIATTHQTSELAAADRVYASLQEAAPYLAARGSREVWYRKPV